MVPPAFGKLTHKILKDGRTFSGSVTDFKLYPGMGHQSSDDVSTLVQP